MPFRLQAKSIFVTWARCDADPAELLLWLIDNAATPAKIRVAQEHHADGGLHLHAALAWGARKDFRNERFLDYAECHPNIQRCRNWKAALRYLNKEWHTYDYPGGDDDIEDFPEDEPEFFDLMGAAAEFSTWRDWCNHAYNKGVSFQYAKAAWDEQRAKHGDTILEGDPILGTIENFHLQCLRFDETTLKALVIMGPTGCGKSTWAFTHAPKPALVVKDREDVKFLREGYHRSVIFDDFTCMGDENGKGRWPRQAQIHLVDSTRESPVFCRYSNGRIPAGVFRIFTCNPGSYPLLDDPAINRRVQLIDLGS